MEAVYFDNERFNQTTRTLRKWIGEGKISEETCTGVSKQLEAISRWLRNGGIATAQADLEILAGRIEIADKYYELAKEYAALSPEET